jgi:hypothetical protein
VKISEKIKSVRFVSGARLYHELKMSAATNNFFANEEWPEKERNVQNEGLLLRFEPGPNPARTRTLSLLAGPALALVPGRAEA